MIKLLIFTLLFILCVEAFAGPSMIANVKNVRVRDYVAYVKLEGCAKYSKIYFNTDYEKAMYSTALAAGVSGKSVRVEFVELDGCDTIESELKYLDIQF